MAAILIGAVVLVVVIATLVLAARSSGKGLERVARCRSGHLFSSFVIPGASFKAVRLGRQRFGRCPVGRHWTLYGWVDPASLTPEQLAEARAHRDSNLP